MIASTLTSKSNPTTILQNLNEQTSETPQLDAAEASWAVSVCFWFTLLLAASIYGSVALAPKLSVWKKVRAEYQANLQQLVTLEKDVDYLERVDTALQTDPEFVKNLMDFSNGFETSKGDGDSEFIPVSGNLLFGRSDEAITVSQTAAPDMIDGLLHHLATWRGLRLVLLLVSAFLTMFAFTFFNDAGSGFVVTTAGVLRKASLLPAARYFATKSEVADELDVDDEVESRQPYNGRHEE